MRPNVVMISIDCLRSDAVYSDNTHTPFIDSLQDHSTVFKSHHATGAWTAPSFIGAMTGSHPHTYSTDFSIDYYPETLAERMKKEGYATVATLDSNYWISSSQSFDRGFDSFTNFVDVEEFEQQKKQETSKEVEKRNRLADILPATITNTLPGLVDRLWEMIQSNDHLYQTLQTTYRALTVVDRSVGAENVNKQFINEITGVSEPVFGWVHYMDLHHPYRPKSISGTDRLKYPTPRVNILNSRAVSDDDITESDAKALRYLYDRVVEDIDCYLATLIQNIRRTFDRRTILLIVGDHGEEFGEHGKFTHSNRPYEELIHVPLLIVDGTDRCIDALTSSIGIKPAIRRLITGENYLPPLRTDPVCRYIGGNSVPERTKRALNGFEDVSAVHTKLSDGVKCMYDGTFETYDLKTDPGEKHDVTQFDEHSDLMRATIQERAVERQQIMDQQILNDISQEDK